MNGERVNCARSVLGLVVALLALAATGCIGIPIVPNRLTPTPLPPPPTAPPAATPVPTAAAMPPAIPPWWPADLVIPAGAVLSTGARAPAVWSTRDLNVDGIKDLLLQQAARAGYSTHVITRSEGSIYDLLLVKDAATFTLNMTQGSEATILRGDRTGILHLKTTGAVNLKLDLPLRERLDLTPGSEISIGTSVPNPRCAACEYMINVHIAPFQGPGNYTSKPTGNYIIDVQLVPGGIEETDDYRWAKQCAVAVNDARSGSFTCGGLENIHDNTKVIDVSGAWQQPPAP